MRREQRTDLLKRIESARSVARVAELALYHGDGTVDRDDIRYALTAVDILLDDVNTVLVDLDLPDEKAAAQ